MKRIPGPFLTMDYRTIKGLTQGISRNEVKVAISRMKNGKATGMDGIPVVVWKCLGEEGIDMLWDLMKGIYEQEKIPTEWRDSVIIPIYKEKGDIQDCGNYRGIKLMSHTMKIWERIIDRRLREETTIGDEQFGFMPGRGTTDAIFAVRQLMEKHREKQKELHMVFVDLEKAYDRVPRQEVWRCMREKGVPEIYVMIVRKCQMVSSCTKHNYPTTNQTASRLNHLDAAPIALVRSPAAYATRK